MQRPRKRLWWSLLLGCGLATTAAAQQPKTQQPPGPVTVTAKITAIEAKGRLKAIKVQDDAGNERSFDLSPRTPFEVHSAGDEGFFAPGLFVQIDAIQVNNLYFGSAFLVYPDQASRLPPAKAVKAPPQPGESTLRYFVSGEIARFEKVEDGKYDLLHLRVNPKTELTVYIERNRELKVVRNDPELAAVGQSVSIEGRSAGGRFVPAKITIDTGEELKGEEFLASRKEKDKK
jgi:3D (Asp-Asp-Asp) domain-containing protein